ncbi:MAG: o-succinylbenzoate synthase [Muribaculaceae bacterium]|nr:o-succinylbenzoate synthase [Muribaculaceae bacterium]
MHTAIQWTEYPLEFAFVARTSRETMRGRSTFLLRMADESQPGGWRYGEANFFESLAPESRADFLSQLEAYCCGELDYDRITSSAVRCGADMLELPLPDTAWTRGEAGIPINGLIWMADKETMRKSIAAKLDQGFRVLKLKIGGITFDDEVDLLRDIRKEFSSSCLELRLDANGSFLPEQALERLDILSEYDIHSIEQPIKAGMAEAMAMLCRKSPIAIALDEELIGLRDDCEKNAMLKALSPAYIILKPALCGGIKETVRWKEIAEANNVGWWMTSALESSIGLYYLAAHASVLGIKLPQGLGTGQIYTNNIGSPLQMSGPMLRGGRPGFDCRQLDSLQWQ